ncbi:uncharacterized protein LOC129766138 [Toxorhynchites rutilus septentrionalis]|uniref:uncharacterized protein LOC129766138 n=1 Tax=Toxorhynchites rutilus septentrionalis TaxID=329112 RepID=UPI002478C658|nr:uncharacterized protein LOC129766138 [Toxorhynchites rutilus septentrionalis]
MSGGEELMACPYNRSHRIRPLAMSRHLYKCRRNHPSTKMDKCPFNSTHLVPKQEIQLHTIICNDRAHFELYKYCVSSTVESKKGKYRDAEPELIYNNDPPVIKGKISLEKDECWDKLNRSNDSPVAKGKTLLDNDKSWSESDISTKLDSTPELIYHNDPPVTKSGTLLDDDECWDDSNVPAYNPLEYISQAKVIRKAPPHMKPSEKKQFRRNEQIRLKSFDMQKLDKELNDISASFSQQINIRRKKHNTV